MRHGAALGVLIAVIAVAGGSALAQDADVSVTGHSLGNTAIITLVNSGSVPVASVDMWLAAGNSFESFKTGAGWTGSRQAEALISFSASVPPMAGESAQFGVETSAAADGINWRALDAAGNTLAQGKVVPGETPPPPPPPPPGGEDGGEGEEPDAPDAPPAGIIDGTSQFRVVPSGPHQGATIRVVGDGFGANSTLSLSLGSADLGSIETGESGRFVYTTTVPSAAPAARVDFALSDDMGNTLQRPVRIDEPRVRTVGTVEVIGDDIEQPLTAGDVAPTILGGKEVGLSGSANPGASLLVTLKHPLDYAISVNTLKVGPEGTWSRSINTQSSWSPGRYTAVIYDGSSTVSRSWDLESGLPISIQPRKFMYNPGDTLLFGGTAQPNLDLEVILENPQGTAVYEDIIAVGESGSVAFEILTETPYPKGTYVMFLAQGTEESISYVGLGARPEIPFVVKMDKLNYAIGETATISVLGRSESDATLVVVHPAKKQEEQRTKISLDAEGNYVKMLDLSEFTRGIYAAIAYYGNNSADRTFTVGLQSNAGTMTISTTKTLYTPGELVTVLGVSERAQSLVDVVMISPSGDETKTIETFTTEGKKFTASFFVRSSPEQGTWTLMARSGTQSAMTSFDVVVEVTSGIKIQVSETPVATGKAITIRGEGAAGSQPVDITVTHNNGETIFAQVARSTAEGAFSGEWIIPRDQYPGVYTIRAADSASADQATYTIE